MTLRLAHFRSLAPRPAAFAAKRRGGQGGSPLQASGESFDCAQDTSKDTEPVEVQAKRVEPLKGFTLIELMVVSSIITVVMLVIYSSFISGLRLWQRSQNVSQMEYKVMLGLEKFSLQLRRSIDFPQEEGQCTGFSGGKDKFSFYSLNGQELTKITFEFDPAKKSLMRKEEKYQDVLEGKEAALMPFIASIEGVDFSYFYNDKTQQKFLWKDDHEWKPEDGIPVAVKIAIKYKNGIKSETVFIPIG